MIENKERAATWVRGLGARGVTVTVRNNRLWLHPASAHAALSDDEVLTLRHCRQEIKAIVKAGLAVRIADKPAQPASLEGADLTPVPAPQPCPYCGLAPCVGADHSAYSALHHADPEEVKKRDERATKEMMQQFGKALPDWYRE